MTYKTLLNKLKGSHDLVTLPDWGPYTKKYIGTSHLSDKIKGLRFDLSLFPGFYSRRVDVPNVFYETEYYPWKASTDGSYYKFRHMLEWKDKLYADISYQLLDEYTQGIKVNYVNNKELPENLVLHLMSSMHFPSIKEYGPNNILYPAEVKLPEHCFWIDSTDYTTLDFNTPKPTDNLVADGKLKGEIRTQNFVNGSGIEFGKEAEDSITFKVTVKEDLHDAAIRLRYTSAKRVKLKMVIENCKDSRQLSKKQAPFASSPLELSSGNEPKTEVINISNLNSGTYFFKFTSTLNSEINLDGFAVGSKTNIGKTEFKKTKWDCIPEIIRNSDNSIILKYKNCNRYYGIVWDYPVEDSDLREYYCRDLDIFFKMMANEHVAKKLYGEGKGHYTNVFLRPITVPANSEKEIYCAVSVSEDVNSLTQKLNSLTEKNKIKKLVEKENVVAHGNALFDYDYEKEKEKDCKGNKYSHSVNLMKAVLLTNIVYPVYTQKNFIRHSTPGKWWDSLYTWDSGFIGLGLMEMDITRAIENLNAYLTEVGSQSAFIHHGSPVPVQHYLFFELWNRTQSKELLEYFYPQLKQYYMFLSGNAEGSTTRKYKTNLLQTWDYFYNSGGWDDYPPQYHMHKENIKGLAPVITTAHVIRIAKFLRMYADILDLIEDAEFYKKDINILSNALQQYSWDKCEKYFNYVKHNYNGEYEDTFKTENGENFNKGLDGAYPLFSGICNSEQEEALLSKIKSPKHIWSNAGLSAVDQSASYYRKDGYWNGTVWMAHQWFFWKTLLDLGEYKFAQEVAFKALDVWKQETDSSYRCLEHFLIETQRGAGWHAFGGLSSPVINWFYAYFKPGTVNTGFDTIILDKKTNDLCTEIKLKLKLYPRTNNSSKTSILIALNPNFEYSLAVNDKDIELVNAGKGNVIINISTETNNLFPKQIIFQVEKIIN